MSSATETFGEELMTLDATGTFGSAVEYVSSHMGFILSPVVACDSLLELCYRTRMVACSPWRAKQATLHCLMARLANSCPHSQVSSH